MDIFVNDHIEQLFREDINHAATVALRDLSSQHEDNIANYDCQIDVVEDACCIVMDKINEWYSEDQNDILRLHLIEYAALLFSGLMDAVDIIPEEIHTPARFSDYCVLVILNISKSL